MTVKERLLAYLKEKSIGRNKFEAMAGISLGYITNLKSTPKEGHLVKILNAAPDLNRVWLLTGEGSMLNGIEDESMDTSSVPSWMYENMLHERDKFMLRCRDLERELAEIQARLAQYEPIEKRKHG